MIGLSGHVLGSEVFSLTLINSVLFGIVVVIIVPYLLLKVSKSANWLIFVGLFIMVTQLKARNDLVIGAFKIPVFRVYDMPEVMHYTPSIYENLVVVASASLVSLLYIIFEPFRSFRSAEQQGGPLTMEQFDGKDILEIMHEDLQRALKKPRTESRWAMAIDLKKCIGCHACTTGCMSENLTPPEIHYRPVKEEETR